MKLGKTIEYLTYYKDFSGRTHYNWKTGIVEKIEDGRILIDTGINILSKNIREIR